MIYIAKVRTSKSTLAVSSSLLVVSTNKKGTYDVSEGLVKIVGGNKLEIEILEVDIAMPDDYAPGDEYNTDKNEFKKTGYRDDPPLS